MSQTGKSVSNVIYLDTTQFSDGPPASRNTVIPDSADIPASHVPDYNQLADSMQLLRNELRAAEASLGLFQQEIEQSLADSLQLNFTGERRSSR